MKKLFINILVCFILNKTKRKACRRKLLERFVEIEKREIEDVDPTYAIVYPKFTMSNIQPEIYNKDGSKMETFFLRDYQVGAHHPSINYSKYFLFDRYNYSLDTHFYTLASMYKNVGTPLRKYGLLLEIESIEPNVYKILEENSDRYLEFDNVFTMSEKVLNKVENSKFVPFHSFPLCKICPEKQYQVKNKEASIIASNKRICDMHVIRQNFARKCEAIPLVDTYGTFNRGNAFDDINTAFLDYRYSIVIENDISGYYYTEKITNCFATQTIPIYIGATKIHEFFNIDGIIQISPKDIDNLDEILKHCTEKEYHDRLPAILDNYERAKNIPNPYDEMYLKHIKK